MTNAIAPLPRTTAALIAYDAAVLMDREARTALPAARAAAVATAWDCLGLAWDAEGGQRGATEGAIRWAVYRYQLDVYGHDCPLCDDGRAPANDDLCEDCRIAADAERDYAAECRAEDRAERRD